MNESAPEIEVREKLIKRILLADDSENIRVALGMLFVWSGYNR